MKGFKIAQHELCLTNILKTIAKLKAATSALVENNPKISLRAKIIYWTNNIIYSDTGEECPYRQSTQFLNFLEEDRLAKAIEHTDKDGKKIGCNHMNVPG